MEGLHDCLPKAHPCIGVTGFVLIVVGAKGLIGVLFECACIAIVTKVTVVGSRTNDGGHSLLNLLGLAPLLAQHSIIA